MQVTALCFQHAQPVTAAAVGSTKGALGGDFFWEAALEPAGHTACSLGWASGLPGTFFSMGGTDTASLRTAGQ